MKKYICILLFGLFSAVMFGQPTYQHRMDTAIDIGTHDSPFTFTDSRYTGDFGDDFYWDVDYPPYLGVKEIFYRITLTNSMTVRFNVTRPDRCWTNVILLDDTGKRWEYNSRAYKAFGLIPGVYYFVVEGQQSGNLNDPVPDVTIEVQIEGSERTMGEDFLCPFELGSFSDNFNLTPGVDNFDQFRNDYRSAKDMRVDEYTHDVVYRFTLENPMKVSLRQRGVRDEYDYSQSSLMNAAGDTICVSNSGDSNARQLELSAGDYYIYGWGRSFRSSGFSFDLSGTLPPVGSDFFYPVEVGSRFSDFTYTDTQSTSNFSSSKQPEKAGKEVYYRFTITQPMGIGINTCGSAVADTYLKVFSSDRQRVLYFNDDYSGSGACSNTKSACIHIPLLNVSYEFKDKLGRVVLTRQMDGSLAHDTYYVYDEYGNVRFVLPPLASDNLNSAASWTESNEILKKYVYVYRYDRLNRCIYKKLPGCDPVYTVYDAADRPVFTQDGEQRTKGEWSFSIPDAFNRVVLTGICKNNPDYTAEPLKDVVVKGTLKQAAGSVKGYSISGITLNTPTVLSAVYYDSYGFMGKSNSIPNDATTAYAEVPGYDQRYPGGCRGQQTGSYIAKLSKTGTVTGYVYQVMYYDDRYRIVQQRGNNELGGTDLTCTLYSFTGKPTQVKQVHSVPGKETITEVRQHTYDHADRLLRTSYQLNTDAPVTLVDHVYDELGQLKSDRRNGNGKLRSDYAYNVRSWMKSVSGPLFSQTLNYQESMAGTIPCYNGNISSMSWKAGSETADRGYRFTYDGLSRLKDATYGEGNDLTTNPNRFNEQITGYDKMGNILKLKRHGQISAAAYGLVDDLSLTYNGNQLLAVKDIATSGVYGNGTDFKDGANQTTEYAYDKNGNLIKDLNKNISNVSII